MCGGEDHRGRDERPPAGEGSPAGDDAGGEAELVLGGVPPPDDSPGGKEVASAEAAGVGRRTAHARGLAVQAGPHVDATVKLFE